MRSGEIAERAGVNVETLRYYERRGLLHEPKRRPSGYRMYEPDTIDTVRFIKKAQELGFSLAAIEVLLGLAHGGPENCDAALKLAGRKIEDIDRRIATLRKMLSALRRLRATCAQPRDRRECPLLRI